ncbi:MAG: hypothetical protein LUB59_00340 [Candidatus Gastranaerophilales bacterium]|nr:hypothetical protein [Candidatus Gastranaerophilales bacterium]
MDEFFEKFINEITKCNALEDCYILIDKCVEDISGFKELDLNLFKYGEFYIRTGKRFNLEYIAGNLEEIKELQLSSAPEFVIAAKLHNNEDMVLITKISGSSGGEFENYMRVRNNLTTETKKLVVNDFDKMASKGFYNPAMVDSASNWYVISGRVYIDKWSVFADFQNDNQIKDKRNILLQMCEL